MKPNMQPDNAESGTAGGFQEQLSASERIADENGRSLSNGTLTETKIDETPEARSVDKSTRKRKSTKKRAASPDVVLGPGSKRRRGDQLPSGLEPRPNVGGHSESEPAPRSTTSISGSSRERRPVIMPAGLPNPMPGKNVIRDDPALRKRLGLDMSEQDARDFRREKVPTYGFPVLPKKDRVPPKHVYGLEIGTSPNVEKWIKTKPSTQGKAEGRTADRRECQYISTDEWQHTVELDENAEIINADTGEIWAYVLRDFMGDMDALNSMNEASKAHCKLVRSVRLEDPGEMNPFAYSAGPLNKREFMACRNLEGARGWTDQQLKLHNHAIHSAHTLLWNMACKKLPPVIIDAMRAEMDKNGLPRADWCSMGEDFQPIVSVESGGQSHELTGLECGPPSAACASLYSRTAHDEKAPEKAPWVISLSTECTQGGIGGNFYVQDLGVRIINAKNSLIVHRANRVHGTTVHDIDHTDKNQSREHRGFSMFINPKLAELWQQHLYDVDGVALTDAKERWVLSIEQQAALSPEAKARYKNRIASRKSREKKKQTAARSKT